MIVYNELSQLGATLNENGITGRQAIVITNSVVEPLYADILIASLAKASWQTSILEAPDGEVYKSLDTYTSLLSQALAKTPDRQTLILGLGGGVTTDMAGFVAATLLRGLRWVAVPTSLLAMVDASVGGKTGVNTPQGKNLVGAFWQPSLVFIDGNVLKTLPKRELQCGLGEIIKHGILEKTLFFWLKEHAKELAAGDPFILMQAVQRSLAVKSAIVARDPRESGERALLNLGHTVGHALEKVLGYGNLPHGIAVGLGLIIEAKFAAQLGLASPTLAETIAELLVQLGLPTSLDQRIDNEQMLEAMLADKKRDGEYIKVPLPYDIGEVAVTALEAKSLGRMLANRQT